MSAIQTPDTATEPATAAKSSSHDYIYVIAIGVALCGLFLFSSSLWNFIGFSGLLYTYTALMAAIAITYICTSQRLRLIRIALRSALLALGLTIFILQMGTLPDSYGFNRPSGWYCEYGTNNDSSIYLMHGKLLFIPNVYSSPFPGLWIRSGALIKLEPGDHKSASMPSGLIMRLDGKLINENTGVLYLPTTIENSPYKLAVQEVR